MPNGTGVVRALTRIENRFLDWARSPRAQEVATQPATGSIDDFRGRKYCVLLTYKKNGDAVPSPLWFGVGNGKLYAHTMGFKVKRIERDPRVRIAPSTFRGRPKAAPIEGTARILESGDEAEAEKHIAANYGIERRLYYRLFGQMGAGVYVEVTPSS